MSKYYLFLILIIGLASCSPSAHFEKKTRFKNNNWSRFSDLNYQIPVEAGKSYSFKGNILTDSTFTQRKMEIGFYLYLPGGENRLEDQNIRILDYELNPLGEKTKEGYQLAVDFKKNLQIDETGILKVQIAFHSQNLDNYGIIGLDFSVFQE